MDRQMNGRTLVKKNLLGGDNKMQICRVPYAKATEALSLLLLLMCYILWHSTCIFYYSATLCNYALKLCSGHCLLYHYRILFSVHIALSQCYAMLDQRCWYLVTWLMLYVTMFSGVSDVKLPLFLVNDVCDLCENVNIGVGCCCVIFVTINNSM